MRFYLLHKNIIDLLVNLFKVWAAFLGMLSGDTGVSIPDFLLLCLVIGLVTVHTCELTKASLSRPTA